VVGGGRQVGKGTGEGRQVAVVAWQVWWWGGTGRCSVWQAGTGRASQQRPAAIMPTQYRKAQQITGQHARHASQRYKVSAVSAAGRLLHTASSATVNRLPFNHARRSISDVRAQLAPNRRRRPGSSRAEQARAWRCGRRRERPYANRPRVSPPRQPQTRPVARDGEYRPRSPPRMEISTAIR